MSDIDKQIERAVKDYGKLKSDNDSFLSRIDNDNRGAHIYLDINYYNLYKMFMNSGKDAFDIQSAIIDYILKIYPKAKESKIRRKLLLRGIMSEHNLYISTLLVLTTILSVAYLLGYVNGFHLYIVYSFINLLLSFLFIIIRVYMMAEKYGVIVPILHKLFYSKR